MQHNRRDFFIIFNFKYVSMLNPLHMVYICTMKHSNLQIKCKSFVAFKVLMLLQVFCCSSFENLLVPKFFCYYQNYFGFVILLLLSRFFCFCGFVTCIIHLFVVLFVFVVSLGFCGTSL